MIMLMKRLQQLLLCENNKNSAKEENKKGSFCSLLHPFLASVKLVIKCGNNDERSKKEDRTMEHLKKGCNQ